MRWTPSPLLVAVVLAATGCSIEQDVRPIVEARPTVPALPTATPADGRASEPAGPGLPDPGPSGSDQATDPTDPTDPTATDEPSPSASPTPGPSATPTSTASPTPGASPSASPTPTPTPSASATPSPSGSASPAATASPSPSPSRNTAPIARDDQAKVPEDGVVDVAVLANDEDRNGDTLTIASVDDPVGGSATIVGDQVRFTPDPDRNGVISFSYRVTDGDLTSRATIIVDVAPVNDAPTAVDDRTTRRRGDAEQVVAVLDNDSDPDGDVLRVVAVGAAGAGSVRIVDGTVRYTPPGVRSTATVDRFTYTIEDAAGVQASALVVVDLT